MYVYRSEGGLAPNGVFFSCACLRGVGRWPGVRPSVRPCVRACVRAPPSFVPSPICCFWVHARVLCVPSRPCKRDRWRYHCKRKPMQFALFLSGMQFVIFLWYSWGVSGRRTKMHENVQKTVKTNAFLHSCERRISWEKSRGGQEVGKNVQKTEGKIRFLEIWLGPFPAPTWPGSFLAF